MFWIPALIAAGASIGSAIIGAVARGASEGDARALLEQARDEAGNIDLPKLEELASTMLPPTELEKIRHDQRLLNAQYGALDKLEEYGRGGLTMSDRAAMDDAMGTVARQEGAGRARIREDMAARGTLGSGAELAMVMNNQQNAAERARKTGMTAAGMAQDRAFDAIMKRGELGGRMREQDWREKSEVARARDLINRYNTVGVAQARMGARQDEFNNALNRHRVKHGQAGELARSVRRSGDITAQTVGAFGNAVAQGVTAAGSAWSTPSPSPYAEPDEPLYPAEPLDYEDPNDPRRS